MHLLTKFHGLVTKKRSPVETRASMMIHADPKVDHTEPPGKPPKLPKFGSYCFRAYTNMVNQETNHELSEFIGFDENMGIVDKVTKYCERTRSDDPNRKCNPTKLTFIGQSEMCDGRVVMYDRVNDFSQIYF